MYRDLLRHRVSWAAQTAAVTLSFLFLFAIVALAQDRQTQGSFAQDRRQNEPGQFDFYVLALSWSPSFCEASQERAQQRGHAQQRSYAKNAVNSGRLTERATRNAAGGRFPSWSTGCGRSTNTAFRPSARCRRRGSTAQLSAA